MNKTCYKVYVYPPTHECILFTWPTFPLPAICKLVKVHGPCGNFFPRWFFDADTGMCDMFIYGGCEGNENNFGTKEDCQKMCPNKCPPLPCDVHCKYGHVIDSAGCPICECIDPCKVGCFMNS